ncbi:MAG: 5-methyltetrahydrofolate corrinoid/iron sulfur protein methyltransferase, partial [Thermodesulfobacteriota bacterium]|nr:5-methyltetrahydrofolate corrinoid/iron sulfur protein methyltransferase [Thermodesulfobacteriota bacterium]
MIKVVAENINIMSKITGTAMREKDPKPIQEWAEKLTQRGADVLDLNLGPARKGGPEMMQWLVQTVQEVTDLPLFLDTTNNDAVEAGLQVYKTKTAPAIINSIMATPERMTLQMPLVNKYDCEMVGLMWGPQGIPRDENERSVLLDSMMTKAGEYGIPFEKIWFDPIVVPVSSQQLELQGCTTFMQWLPELAPGCQSTCGLSNVSNGSPDELRDVLNQVYLCMLKKCGITSAILDGFDEEIVRIAHDQAMELENLVGSIMDGEEVDTASMNKKEKDYV